MITRLVRVGLRGEGLLARVPLVSFALLLTSAALSQPIEEFAMPPGTSFPTKIVAGPDGNLWFAGSLSGIGRITTSGVVTQILTPIAAQDLAFDREGNLWFTEQAKIGRLPRNGLLVEFSLPAGSSANSIAVGDDDNIWFTEPSNSRIGRITKSGSITEYPVAVNPGAITAGPDGNMWFTAAGDRVGSISPSGVVTIFPVGGDNPYGLGRGITTGPDGAVWFTGPEDRIRRITTAGVVSDFPLPRFQGLALGGICSGPDGNLWFTETSAPVGGRGPLPPVPPSKIGRITPEGAITEYLLPQYDAYPLGITSGPDGNLWVAEYYVNQIARILLPIQLSPLPPPCERCPKKVPFRTTP